MIDQKNDKNFHEILIGFASLLPITGVITLVLSTLYETFFYQGLGISINLIPIAISDVINITISWLPKTVMITLGISILNALTQILVRFSDNKYFLFFTATIIIIIFFIYKIINNEIYFSNNLVNIYIVLLILLVICLTSLVLGYIFKNKTKYGTFDFVLLFIIILISSTVIFGFKAGEAVSEFPATRDVITLEDNTIINNIKIIRNYQSGVLVINSEGIITFYSRDIVKKISTLGKEALWRLEGG